MKNRKDSAKHISIIKKRAKNDIFREKYLSPCFYINFKPNSAYFIKNRKRLNRHRAGGK
jgi:hypothetical protein